MSDSDARDDKPETPADNGAHPSAADQSIHDPGAVGPIPPPRAHAAGSPAYDLKTDLRRLIAPLASLKLTCILFALSILLVFFGTLAQVEMGLWTAVGSYFRWFYVWIPFQLLVMFGQKFFGVSEDLVLSGSFPFPGGLTLGILLLANLLAAHIVRFKLSWKRGGVLLLHAGLIVMMLGELIAYAQVEGIMVIEEGESSNYVMHTRSHELAIVGADGDRDSVAVVPAAILKQGGRIEHQHLPFDIIVDEYMVNADFRDPRPGERSRATAGSGQGLIAVAAPEVSGVSGDRDDVPTAYLTFKKKGSDETLGTYLVSLLLAMQDVPQKVSVGDKTYDVFLRYKRTYKPYRLELLDFRFDRYLGTSTPRNFSSQVRVIDPELKENREVLIRMNEPLFYRGETFYQAGYNERTERGTRLQVVHNVGWWLPYVSCVLVAMGMLWHFGIHLVGFLRQQDILPAEAKLPKHAARPLSVTSDEGWLRYLPIGVVVLGAVYLVAASAPRSEPADGFHLQNAARLTVLDHGRVKPLDTLARTSLMIINNRQTYRDAAGKEQPAIRWLWDVMTSGLKEGGPEERVSIHIPAFRISNDQLRIFLNLPERRDRLYSYMDIAPKRKELADEVERAFKTKKEEQWDDYDKALADLVSEVGPYEEYARYETPHRVFRIENDQVRSLLGLPSREGLRYSYGEFVPRISPLIREGVKARQIDHKKHDAYQAKLVELMKHVELYIELARMVDYKSIKTTPDRITQLMQEARHGPFLVPPLRPGEEWQPFMVALVSWLRDRPKDQGSIEAIFTMATAYQADRVPEFNKEVDDYQALLDQKLPDETARARFETFFNRVEPFYQCEVLYIAVLLVTLLTWVAQGFMGADARIAAVHRSVFCLVGLIFVVHTFAILGRMYIQGRPPVTNLYSSAVFIGWGSVLMGLILEWIFRIGIGNAVAGVMGFVTSIIAHHLAAGGDTLEMMQAVLDTNFWLATHVTCVTFGYAATFVAGFVAIAFILMGLFTPLLTREAFKSISQIIYGIVCFATLLSFTGTVLGGIWADQSWGRFWGWDPKENGALLIVVWNALILHARWCGWVKQRGVAVLALVGNMITAWSWFGTNQLGVGLHSYGFNETLAVWIRWFWLTHLGLIGIGLIPTERWRSFGRDVPVPAGRKPRKPKGKDHDEPAEVVEIPDQGAIKAATN